MSNKEPPQEILDFVAHINDQWINDGDYELKVKYEYGSHGDKFIGVIIDKKTKEPIRADIRIPLDEAVPHYVYRAMFNILTKGIELGIVTGVESVIDNQTKQFQNEIIEGLRDGIPRQSWLILRDTHRKKQNG